MYFDLPKVSYIFVHEGGYREKKTFTLEKTEAVSYYLNDPADFFEVERLTPYLYAEAGSTPVKADGQCGQIIYKPIRLKDAGYDVINWDEAQINPSGSSSENLKFKIYSGNLQAAGIHNFEIYM